MGLRAVKQHLNKAGKPLRRGAKPTPRHRLCAATPHKVTSVTPLQMAWLAKLLEMWLNDLDGCCVSSEECAAIACYSSGLGLPEVHITDAVLLAFCNKNDLLNGADLDQVIQLMQQQGLTQDGVTYTDGPGTVVDYSNEAALQNAISQGPVKIGIDADALPSGAGNTDGWIDADGTPGQYTSEDHCVGCYGFGPAAWIVQQLQTTYNVTITLPSSIAPTDVVYVIYTWGTMGIVTHNWIMSTCGEAWLRTPTTLVNGVPEVGPTPAPTPVPPAPTPTPTPVPPGPSPQPSMFTIPALPVAWEGIHIPGLATIPQTVPMPMDSLKDDLTVPIPMNSLKDDLTICQCGHNHKQHAYWYGPCRSCDCQYFVNSHRAMPMGGMGDGAVSVTIPPWLLALLRAACAAGTALPFPYSLIVGFICPLISKPQVLTAEGGLSLSIPPWIVTLLEAGCSLVKYLPDGEAKNIAGVICQLLPLIQKAKGDCGCK